MADAGTGGERHNAVIGGGDDAGIEQRVVRGKTQELLLSLLCVNAQTVDDGIRAGGLDGKNIVTGNTRIGADVEVRVLFPIAEGRLWWL